MPVGKPQKKTKAQTDAQKFRSGKRVRARGAEQHAQGNVPRKNFAQLIREHRQGGNR